MAWRASAATLPSSTPNASKPQDLVVGLVYLLPHVVFCHPAGGHGRWESNRKVAAKVDSTDISDDRARAIRNQYAATAQYELEQRLRSVRCPLHDTPLSKVQIVNGEPDIDGCCGAMAEAGRVLQTI